MSSPKWLTRAADASVAHGWTMGALLKEYMESEGRTVDQLASDLRVATDAFLRLTTCRSPRLDHFAADVHTLAERFGASPTVLTHIVRTVNACRSLRFGEPEAESQDVLLAARDRRDTEDEDGQR